MPIIGYNSIGGISAFGINRIRGSYKTATEDGDVTSISFYTSDWTAGNKIKCALYESSNNKLGETEELTTGQVGGGWVTFNFASPISITNGTAYSIVVFIETDGKYYYDGGVGNNGVIGTGTYPTFPASLSLSTTEYSVYATYTAVGADVTVTPDALVQNISMPAPTFTVDVEVSPSALVQELSIPTPTVVGDAHITIEPSVLDLEIEMPKAVADTKAITVEINSVDRNDHIIWETLNVKLNLTNLVDTATFSIRKYGSRSYTPAVDDEVIVYDGAVKIFGGSILRINEKVESIEGVIYSIECVDWSNEFNSQLVSKTYENKSIEYIIDDIVTNFTDGTFTTTNVTAPFIITNIVFNQVKPIECLKRLAKVVNKQWYIDPDKDIHFFAKFTELAPYDLEDDSGNYVYKSLARQIDGTQLANKVLVRGGEYDASTYTDDTTVKGSDTKSYTLPYKFKDLTVELDTGAGFVAQTVGIDFVDQFSGGFDVLHNYAEKTIKWEVALADGDIIRFSGLPKVPILVVAEDTPSILAFGEKQKMVIDKSIEDIATARERAKAELSVYAQETENANFKTYTAGLRAGQTINLTSVVRSANTDFIIKSVSFRAVSPDNFDYKVDLMTTEKYNLIEMLNALLEPDPIQADDAEVAEILKTDIVTVSIAELISVTSAVTDIVTVSIAEDIQKDPLGAGVEPTWVLAPYFPSSITDTKREGRLDYSLKVY